MLAISTILYAAWTPVMIPGGRHASPVRGAGRVGLPTMEYGDNCYEGALEPLPNDCYEVLLERPLGIGFEEDGPIIGKSGVSVNQIVSDSNAARGAQVLKNVDGTNQAVAGKVEVGDKLIGVTAIRFVGSKWERELFNCRKWSFETVVDAIGSNEEKFISNNVILQFERPAAAAKSEVV